MKRQQLGMIAAALLWSTGGTAIKVASLPPAMIAGGRALISGVLILLLLPGSRVRPNRRIILVALPYATVCTLFVFANTFTTAGNAIFIQNTAPVWVLLASPYLLGERPTTIEKISVPICLFGCLLFFLDDPELGMLKGNIIAFLSGLAYAALVIAWRKASHEEGLAGTAYGNLLIAAVMIPFVDLGQLHLTGGLAIVYLGTLQQTLPAILFLRGVRHTSAVEASLITLLEPVFSPILAYLVVRETLGPLSILGGATIIAATVWRIRAVRVAGDLTVGDQRYNRGSVRSLVIIALLIVAAVGGAYFYLQWSATTPIDKSASATSPEMFDVPKGATLNQVGKALVMAGFCKSEILFKIWIKLHPETPPPKAGKHEINKGMNLPQILAVLGENPISEDVPLTMVEGWRLRDTDKWLAEHGWIEAGAYEKAASDKTKFQLPFPVDGDTLSGYLFPETYLVPPGKLDVEKLIQRQLIMFKEQFAEPNAKEIQDSGRPLHTIVIVASMLEREEPKPENRPDVAGVMYKRLSLNTPLGVDATSRFTLADWNDEHAFVKMLKDPNDPYNTRLRPGLPPGPIGEPGLGSLLGAMRGKPGKWLYYLHDKDGNVHFARNGDEHDRNRKKYNVW